MDMQERDRRTREQPTAISGEQACVVTRESRETCVFVPSVIDICGICLYAVALGALIFSIIAAAIVVWPTFEEAVWLNRSGDHFDYSRVARDTYDLIWTRAGFRIFVPIAAAVSVLLFGIALARDRCGPQRHAEW